MGKTAKRTGGARPPRTAEPAETSPEPLAPDEGIDSVLTHLEGVVAELESGELSLEDALLRFEQGVGLARRGGQLLAALEERVEVLLSDRDEAVPFDPGEQEGDDD